MNKSKLIKDLRKKYYKLDDAARKLHTRIVLIQTKCKHKNTIVINNKLFRNIPPSRETRCVDCDLLLELDSQDSVIINKYG